MTDANLVLGRLLPEHFPKIFGPNEDMPLDREATLAAFDKLTEEVQDILFMGSLTNEAVVNLFFMYL